jgi:flagellar hook protein FlgE
MLTALYTAVSGMDANSTSLSVIGDNIANINTVGFKESDISFGDVLSQSLDNAGTASQVGRGVEVTSVSPNFSQGSLETTTNGLDLAINGDGLFMVNQGAQTSYTRAGQFSLDQNGNIVNPEGEILQGYLANAAGQITGTIGNLQIAANQSPANITTTVSASLNLDATATPPAAPFTLDGNGTGIPNDPANYNSSNTVTVYDSQGVSHQVTMYFVKTAANTWDVHYAYPDPAAPGQLIEPGQTSGGVGKDPTGAATTQTLTWNANGGLVNDNSNTAINFNFGGGVVTPQAINFNYGTGTAEGGTGLDMSTQYGSPFSVTSVNQDGYSSGSLQSVNVSNTGIINGVFTNGQTRTIGQVALSRFIAETDLTKDGQNLYSQSSTSGPPVIGMANTSGLGTLSSSSLELSNVDLAQQFVEMISAQRGYEANSKVITTSDQMLQDLVNLKQ